MQITTIGIDLAKHVFQVHGVDGRGKAVLKKQLKRETAIESVRLNPYAMSITIRGLNIKDLDSKPLLSWDEVYVNFRLCSIFSHAWGFDGIRVKVDDIRSPIPVEVKGWSTYDEVRVKAP